MNCSPSGSSVHGIFQARILEWAAIFYSRASSWLRDWTCVSCMACRFFTVEPPGKPRNGGDSTNQKYESWASANLGISFFDLYYESVWLGDNHSFLRCEIFSKPDVQKRLGARMFTCMLSHKPPKPSKMMIIEMYWAFLVAQMVKKLSAMQETQVQSLSQEDPLEMEMATHSSILALRIPWTVEPGGLQSVRSQRVGHDEWLTLSHHWYHTQGFTYWQCLIPEIVKHLWKACGQTSKHLMWKDSW